MPAALTDFLLNAGAILLSITLYSRSPWLLNALLLGTAAVVHYTKGRTKKVAKPKERRIEEKKTELLPKKAFVTTYRGAMMMVTCLAILAVDFKVFPRRFAKAETWGTSLMDMGVGSFVFSAGVVSVRPILKGKIAGDKETLLQRLTVSLRHSIPLIILGLVRLYSVKGLEYPEHVTEYGVHWNFFFTLGLLPPFVACFQSLFDLVPSYTLLSVLLGIVYQIVLDQTKLKDFVLTAPRTDLLSQNREGVFSFIGYLSIFLAGEATGMIFLPTNLEAAASMSLDAKLLHAVSRRIHSSQVVAMAIWASFWIVLFEVAYDFHALNLPVSRRLANLPYVFWVAAFNIAQLSGFYMVESLSGMGTSRLLAALNRNGLLIFLVANLLTGGVNLALRTLDYGHLEAMGILFAYAGVICAFALGLDGITPHKLRS